jgi:CheY-specific phosphatase CheX
MSTNWQAAMKIAISEVMETMFFVPLDFFARQSTNKAYPHGSKIRLINPEQQVEIVFRTTESFARMITANFLSKRESEVVPEEIEDVLRELANMVGGNYMSRMRDEGWQLGIPCFEGSPDGARAVLSGMSLSYLGEDAGVVDVRSIPSDTL